MVKLPHAVKKLERGFFTASSYREISGEIRSPYQTGSHYAGRHSKMPRIERYIVGPVFNLDMFYSPIEPEMSKLELLGVDWRFEDQP